MGRICIFCQQQRQMSNEHIFPQWLQEYLDVRQEVLYVYSTDSNEPRRTLVYDKHLNGMVCKHCNNGWMSKIEGTVKPILISMLDCESSLHINPNQAMILAWWVYKTALTLHSASPYSNVIPQRHYELALQQIAPAHFMIAIAYCSNEILKPSWIQNQNWTGISRFIPVDNLVKELEKTYRITLGFGNFVARVHYFPMRYKLSEFEQASIQYIHPGDRNGFNWPIEPAISSIHELDQSIVVSSDPEQDAEISKRLLELSLTDHIKSDDNN